MSINNYTENTDKMQAKEQIEGKINRFKNKKEKSLKVSDSMKRIHKKARAIRIKECGTHLVFRICKKTVIQFLLEVIFVVIECAECVIGGGHCVWYLILSRFYMQ